MDPRLGRFSSTDALLGDPNLPWSQHPYGYSRQNPINYVDPTGKSTGGLASLPLAGAFNLAAGAALLGIGVRVLQAASLAVAGIAISSALENLWEDQSYIGDGYWDPGLQGLKDAGTIALAWSLALNLLRLFKKQRRRGPNWKARHEMEIWLPTGLEQRSTHVKEVRRFHWGRNSLTIKKGGIRGRVFEVRYSIGGAEKDTPDHFLFRMDYQDFRGPYNKHGIPNLHCHIGFYGKFYSKEHLDCLTLELKPAPGIGG